MSEIHYYKEMRQEKHIFQTLVQALKSEIDIFYRVNCSIFSR
jgi:hypothetical protein